MTDLDFSIDLHCHPQYKPFGRAHTSSNQPPESQATNPSKRSSLWYYDPPHPMDKILNYTAGVTKFSQNNLTAAANGRLLVMVVALGCIEQPFFKNKLGTGVISDLVGDFAAEFGRHRIDTIQNMTDYWNDFMHEIQFLQAQENNPVLIDGHWYTYRIAKGFSDLKQNIEKNLPSGENNQPKPGEKGNPLIISLVPSVEGLHILNCGLEQPCDPDKVKTNALALRSLPFPPWFVTFSHHFYNELCGHARSLRKQIGKLTNQEKEINSGFTKLGLEVLDILLGDSPGRRVLIDMKHMSPKGRKEFLEIRKTKYNNSFPIIISHGVSNGLPTLGATVSGHPEIGNTFITPLEDVRGGDGEFKNHNFINFYDDEIVEMVKSGGIMGLQLDERRLANDETISKVPHSLWRNKIMHYRSELVWRQIQYIAELLDGNGLYAWGNLAIGSDYDGLVDPLNGFWTAEQYDELISYVERHAYNYLTNHSDRLVQSANRVKSELVVQNIFKNNAWNFLKTWF